MRRFKDDVKEVQEGFECGIGVQGFTDFEDGDLKRTMRILKMRTTNHSKKTISYEITDDGIQINEKRR